MIPQVKYPHNFPADSEPLPSTKLSAFGNHRPLQLSDCVFSCTSYQQEKASLDELELFTEDMQQPDI